MNTFSSFLCYLETIVSQKSQRETGYRIRPGIKTFATVMNCFYNEQTFSLDFSDLKTTNIYLIQYDLNV